MCNVCSEIELDRILHFREIVSYFVQLKPLTHMHYANLIFLMEHQCSSASIITQK